LREQDFIIVFKSGEFPVWWAAMKQARDATRLNFLTGRLLSEQFGFGFVCSAWRRNQPDLGNLGRERIGKDRSGSRYLIERQARTNQLNDFLPFLGICSKDQTFLRPPSVKLIRNFRFVPFLEEEVGRILHAPACLGNGTTFAAALVGRTLNHFSASAFVASPL